MVLTAIIISALSELQEVLFSVGNSFLSSFLLLVLLLVSDIIIIFAVGNKISKKNGTNQKEDLSKGQAVGQNSI